MTDGTTIPGEQTASRTRWQVPAGWCLVAIWLAATVTGALSAGSSTQAVAQAIYGIALAVFVVLHALTLYRPSGAAAYFALAVAVSFGLEACSVATGFPFGFYVHHMEGPRALGVPFTVVAAWVILAWLAWNLARVIVGGYQNRRLPVVATPIVATLILGGYDLVIDPIGAYVRGLFSYGSPSGALGVPLSNYVGWVITGWVLFQLFALVERRWRRDSQPAAVRSTLVMPVIVWLGLALQVNLEMLHAGAGSATIQGGRSVPFSDIYATCVATTWFTMGLVVAIAVARLCQGGSQTAA